MCGIFGYIGRKEDAAQIVFEGLKLLEYRGYDSWGIATKVNPFDRLRSSTPRSLRLEEVDAERSPAPSGAGRSRSIKSQKSKVKSQIVVEKHVGKIAETDINSKFLNLKSQLAIGHTRWATHGGVTVAYAHPHLDCKNEIAVIHNGIIENFSSIKENLSKKSHIFKSETDTEIVSHLIEEFSKTEGFSFAVRDAFNSLKGLNAIVVVCRYSREIVAAKTGSPLVVGIGNNELFIASDVSGIVKHTRKMLFLKDNEMVILGDDVELISLPNGNKIHPRFETVDWKIEDVDKGEYPHFMIKEIYEQPTVIRNITQNYEDQILSLARIIKKAHGTFFIGAGTAFHASLAGTYLFSKISKMHVNTAVASEFNYLEDFLNKDSLVIALSQSGETIDVIEPLQRARQKGSKIVAITNTLGSTIYRLADFKLLLGAGVEKAVASTKAYNAKLAILLMLAFASVKRINDAKKLLLKAAAEVERVLRDETKNIIKIASVLKKSEDIYTVGRGTSYATALEAALKIKEVSYIHTEGLAGGELKHGTIALISKGTPCIVFAPQDETYTAMISNATEIKARGGVVIGISSLKSEVFDYWIKVTDLEEASIIAQVVPAQLLAYYLAIGKKLDPDKPRNLAKSVTVK